jgi:hypothetical protein
MKKVLSKIFEHHALVDKPPVLVDIGASTALPPQWREIAAYSICIAFDPDRRQMEYIENERGFKKLYIFPAIVHESINGQADFFLTASPECSSTLPPRHAELNEYLFASLFKLEKQAKLAAVTLPAILKELNLDYIDWFKTDSQGTDLRLFKSIPETVRRRTLAAEFEPGIIDAYHGEDKLWALLSFMEQEPFWCSSLKLLGSRRMSPEIADRYFSGLRRRLLHTVLQPAPGWAEVTFLNNLSGGDLGIREYLLGWVFAAGMKQYGAALKIAESGFALYNDALFKELIDCTVKSINRDCIFSLKVPVKWLKRLMRQFGVTVKPD